jgi:hypothetical protein
MGHQDVEDVMKKKVVDEVSSLVFLNYSLNQHFYHSLESQERAGRDEREEEEGHQERGMTQQWPKSEDVRVSYVQLLESCHDLEGLLSVSDDLMVSLVFEHCLESLECSSGSSRVHHSSLSTVVDVL